MPEESWYSKAAKKAASVFVEIPEGDDFDETEDVVIESNVQPSSQNSPARNASANNSTVSVNNVPQKLVDANVKTQLEEQLNEIGSEKIQNFLKTYSTLRNAGQQHSTAFTGALALSEVTNKEVNEFVSAKERALNESLENYNKNADSQRDEALAQCETEKQTHEEEIAKVSEQRKALEAKEQELKEKIDALTEKSERIKSQTVQAKQIFFHTCEAVREGLETEKNQLVPLN